VTLKITEKDWQGTVNDYGASTGWLGYHTFDSRHSVEGFPDWVGLRDERMVVAELKTETGRVSAAQTRWLEAFAAVGAEVYIWRPSDWPEVQNVLGAPRRPRRPATVNAVAGSSGAGDGGQAGRARSDIAGDDGDSRHGEQSVPDLRTDWSSS
jgi:hypothetical protein